MMIKKMFVKLLTAHFELQKSSAIFVLCTVYGMSEWVGLVERSLMYMCNGWGGRTAQKQTQNSGNYAYTESTQRA